MTIASVIEMGDFYEVLAAQNALDFMWQSGHVSLEDAQALIRDREFREPADRIPRYLLQK
jgi:N-sulfoglucosamine sulfohydrolase